MSTTKTARRKAQPKHTARLADAAVGTVVCAVYLRISHDPTGEALGVNRQKPLCLELARSLGWNVPEWAIYCDNDKSATNGKRPEYERMLADIEAGRVQAIVVWHVDRLYRKLADLERLVGVVEGHHVAIRTCASGELDLTTPYGRMVARILGSVATAEGEHKSARWKASLRQHRELGHMPGSGPRMYGWARRNRDGVVEPRRDLEDGALVPEEAEVLRELAQRVIAGASITGLCNDLNARGITTSNGNAWRATSMRKLLRNPRLAGFSVLRGEVVHTKDGKPARGAWAPILDEQTFEVVSALLEGRSRTRGPRVGLLPGLLLCGRCGAGMSTSRRSNGQRTYRCVKGPGLPGCGRTSGDAEPIEAIVEDYTRERLANKRVRRFIANEQRSGHQSELVDELAELRAHRAELEAALNTPKKNGKRRSVAVLVASLDATDDEITQAEARLVAATRQHVSLPEDGQPWPTELAERRKLVELVVKHVTLLPGTGGSFRVERVQVEPVPML